MFRFISQGLKISYNVFRLRPGLSVRVQRHIFRQHNAGNIRQHRYGDGIEIAHYRHPGAVCRGTAHDNTQKITAVNALHLAQAVTTSQSEAVFFRQFFCCAHIFSSSFWDCADCFRVSITVSSFSRSR